MEVQGLPGVAGLRSRLLCALLRGGVGSRQGLSKSRCFYRWRENGAAVVGRATGGVVALLPGSGACPRGIPVGVPGMFRGIPRAPLRFSPWLSLVSELFRP